MPVLVIASLCAGGALVAVAAGPRVAAHCMSSIIRHMLADRRLQESIRDVTLECELREWGSDSIADGGMKSFRRMVADEELLESAKELILRELNGQKFQSEVSRAATAMIKIVSLISGQVSCVLFRARREVMLQVGAAVTDWLLALMSGYSALKLRKVKGTSPRWLIFHKWAYLAESVSCMCGGFLWSTGLNLKSSNEYTPLDIFICTGVVIGMALEGIALVAATHAMTKCIDEKAFARWCLVFQLFIALIPLYSAILYSNGVPGSLYLQPCLTLGAGFPLLFIPCYKNVTTTYPDSLVGSSWRLLTTGHCLNLVGLLVMASLDNACTGASCITEYLPFHSSPCQWNSVPVGASCPLPSSFNHAAIMHILCCHACSMTSSALVALADAGWKPSK
eukprot:TRINITY_DN23938_c0_g3_i1.p1 TRINITY_DN23938_c0_g3~~TRINITY_DN23938_c0_g3_i1.p1  ORF type:complete len:394 (-),score=24.97 TRINITY_DN23938_c0_g3_i1:193-1374(-)